MREAIPIITTNVGEELETYAKKNGVFSSKLYLQIKSITTYIKDNDSDFIEIANNNLDEYKEEEILRNELVEFKQEYSIFIKNKDENYPFNKVLCEVCLEENDTLAYLLIKKGTRLEYYSQLYEDFSNCIIDQMLRSNIMIYLFDTDYKESIKELVDVIKQIKVLTFKDDKKILISKGLGEVKAIKADVAMIIEDKENTNIENSEEKIDYADRGFLLNCIEGEELFEFIKPKQGKHGRACTGNIIEEEVISLEAKPMFTVDDNIEIQDSFENIKYLANKSGYLVKKGNQYEVSNNVDIGEISFKTTGTINSDLDTEISINVVKDDPLEDAIEKGMHVKVQNLYITGSIGPSTLVETRTVSISGQTHKDSLIKCMNADIGIHKGKITGRTVEVKTLDGGEIIADVAIVKNAMSGKIRAKTIEIEILGSRVTMEASQEIQIQKVKGEENKFIFESSIDSGLNQKKNDNDEYLLQLKGEFDELKEAFKTATLKIKKNLEPCEKIKAFIVKKKKEGSEISLDIMKKFKICKMMRINYKKLKEEIEYKKSQYLEEEKSKSTDTNSIRDAKIILGQALHGYNYIQYKLDRVNIELSTQENMKKKTFELIEDEDGILKIINS